MVTDNNDDQFIENLEDEFEVESIFNFDEGTQENPILKQKARNLANVYSMVAPLAFSVDKIKNGKYELTSDSKYIYFKNKETGIVVSLTKRPGIGECEIDVISDNPDVTEKDAEKVVDDLYNRLVKYGVDNKKIEVTPDNEIIFNTTERYRDSLEQMFPELKKKRENKTDESRGFRLDAIYKELTKDF